MIERIMVLVVGALAAGIVALLVLPAFTRRAARLARRDFEASLPMTLAEFGAQKDAQRAVFAAEIARLEARAAQAEDKLVGLMLESERLRGEARAAEASSADLREQAAELQQKINGLRAELTLRDEALGRATAALREVRWRLAAPDGTALRPDLADPASEAAADDVAAALAALRQGIAADARTSGGPLGHAAPSDPAKSVEPRLFWPPPPRSRTRPPFGDDAASSRGAAPAALPELPAAGMAAATAGAEGAALALDGAAAINSTGTATIFPAPLPAGPADEAIPLGDTGSAEDDPLIARALADIRSAFDEAAEPLAIDGAAAHPVAAPSYPAPAVNGTAAGSGRFASIARRLRPANGSAAAEKTAAPPVGPEAPAAEPPAVIPVAAAVPVAAIPVAAAAAAERAEEPAG